MRERSETWRKLVARGEFHMETVARIYGALGFDKNAKSGIDNGVAYREYNAITAPIITHGLLPNQTLSVGNAIAGTMTFTVLTTDTIPKSAKVVIMGRPTDANRTVFGEWKTFGTYWIDQRTQNEELIDLTCYDSMKKANQSYSDNSAVVSWPKEIKTVVTRIAEQLGVEIDSRTVDYLIDSDLGELEVITKPNDEDTLLTILEYIGGIIGGNWIITPENKLRLVQLFSPAPYSNYIIDHDEMIIETDQGDTLIHDENTQATYEHPAGGGLIRVPVVTGSITTAGRFTITKVTMSRDRDNVYSIGTDEGFELVVSENPYATGELCQRLYDRVAGVIYEPFTITSAVYDPATELGDYMVVGQKVCSVVYTETLKFDIGLTVDSAAPAENELESEYPYKTIPQKMKYLAEGLEQARTMIRQTQDEVDIIAETSVYGSNVRSMFALDPTNITLSAGIDKHGRATGVITFEGGTFVVNSDNFIVDASGHVTCYGATINGSIISSGNKFHVDDKGNMTCQGARITGSIISSGNKFSVDEDGVMTCRGATINGSAVINGENFRLDADGNLTCKSANITDSIISSGRKFNVDADGVMTCQGATINGVTVINGSNFSLNAEGKMTCSGAQINGTISSVVEVYDEFYDVTKTLETSIKDGQLIFSCDHSPSLAIGYRNGSSTQAQIYAVRDSVSIQATIYNDLHEFVGGSAMDLYKSGKILFSCDSLEVMGSTASQIYRAYSGPVTIGSQTFYIKNGFLCYNPT